MNENRNSLDYFLLVLKGIAMGAANKVPGVSGGIVAFVAGFYEEFIYSLQKINKNALKLLFKGHFKAFTNYINGKFLAAIILGMIISFFTISKLLDYLLINHELNIWSTFFGMIIGSVYSISKRFEKWNSKSVCFLILGALIGLTLSFIDPLTQNDKFLFVFICGIISVSGMTLPGLSGSFILMILGNYVLLLVDSVNALYDTITEIMSGDLTFIYDPIRMRTLYVLIIFTLGSITGMVIFSHVMNRLLKKFKNETTAIITGFIIGSLGVVWPWKKTIFKKDDLGEYLLNSNNNRIIETYKRFIPELTQETFYAIIYIMVGITAIVLIEWYGAKKREIK